MSTQETCDGPLIWFGVGVPDEDAAVLECGAQRCDYLTVSGNWNDHAHTETPILREGLA